MLPSAREPDSAIKTADDHPEVQGPQVPGGRPYRGELSQAEDAIQEVETQFWQQDGAGVAALDAIKSTEAELAAPNAPGLSESNVTR